MEALLPASSQDHRQLRDHCHHQVPGIWKRLLWSFPQSLFLKVLTETQLEHNFQSSNKNGNQRHRCSVLFWQTLARCLQTHHPKASHSVRINPALSTFQLRSLRTESGYNLPLTYSQTPHSCCSHFLLWKHCLKEGGRRLSKSYWAPEMPAPS